MAFFPHIFFKKKKSKRTRHLTLTSAIFIPVRGGERKSRQPLPLPPPPPPPPLSPGHSFTHSERRILGRIIFPASLTSLSPILSDFFSPPPNFPLVRKVHICVLNFNSFQFVSKILGQFPLEEGKNPDFVFFSSEISLLGLQLLRFFFFLMGSVKSFSWVTHFSVSRNALESTPTSYLRVFFFRRPVKDENKKISRHSWRPKRSWSFPPSFLPPSSPPPPPPPPSHIILFATSNFPKHLRKEKRKNFGRETLELIQTDFISLFPHFRLLSHSSPSRPK